MYAMVKRLKAIQGKKGRINVTMMAEKPSVARKIAEVLSNNKCREMRDCGFARFEYKGKFKEVNAFFRIFSVYGHVYK